MKHKNIQKKSKQIVCSSELGFKSNQQKRRPLGIKNTRKAKMESVNQTLNEFLVTWNTIAQL